MKGMDEHTARLLCIDAGRTAGKTCGLSKLKAAEQIADAMWAYWVIGTQQPRAKIGHVVVTMTEAEYDRMRAALGSEWEWRDEVRVAVSDTPKRTTGSDTP